MIVPRKITVYDIKCDKCGKVLKVGESTMIGACSWATFRDGWNASSFVAKGKPLNDNSAKTCAHHCKDCKTEDGCGDY